MGDEHTARCGRARRALGWRCRGGCGFAASPDHEAATHDGGGWPDSSLPAVSYDQNEYANPESSMNDPYEVDSEGHVGGAFAGY